jgi:hypothetical protein
VRVAGGEIKEFSSNSLSMHDFPYKPAKEQALMHKKRSEMTIKSGGNF